MNEEFDKIDFGGVSEEALTQRSKLIDYVENSEATVAIDDMQRFGRAFIDRIFKLIKIGSIYDIDHNQTKLAADEFFVFYRNAFSQTNDTEISFLIRDELGIVNGDNIRLRRKHQERLNELRVLFTKANIKGLLLKREANEENFRHFLSSLRDATRGEVTMEGVQIPNIEIQHGEPVRHLLEKILNVDKAMYVLHVYIRGLVKVKNMHEEVRELRSTNIATGVIRRIVQSVAQLLADEDYIIMGLLPLRLVAPDLSTHSFNTAIYAMLLADRIGLRTQIISYIGMTVIYQDMDRILGIRVAQRDRETGLNPDSQFSANLRDVARMLDRVKGDTLSTLRILTTYERGCSHEDFSAPFYRRNRNLHLISRMIDLCRTYDLLIQGLEGYRTRRPDLAIEYVTQRAGEAFDETLVQLFVSTLGIYPIGTTVLLTTGEKAIVMSTPDPSRDPRRPIVRMLVAVNPETLDLSHANFQGVEIVKLITIEPSEIAVSKVFLLT